jgi:hypothetical protein
MEEQAEIDNAWNATRTGEQTQKVLAYLGFGKSKGSLIIEKISRFNN